MNSETKYNNCYAFRNQIQQLLCIQKPYTTIVMVFRNEIQQLFMHSETKYNNCHSFRNQIQQLIIAITESKYKNCSGIQKPNTTIVHALRKRNATIAIQSETKYNNSHAFRNQIQQLLCI